MSNLQTVHRERPLGEWLLEQGGPEAVNRRVCSALQSGALTVVAAADYAEGLMAPASDARLLDRIARLAVKCGKRKDDDRSADFTLEVYLEDLRTYPADIAVAVLTYWPDVSKWWPDWKDLCALLEELMVERRRVVDEARKAAGLEPLGVAGARGGEVGILVRQAARKLGML